MNQIVRFSFEHDHSVPDDVSVFCEEERHSDILFDDQDGNSGLTDLINVGTGEEISIMNLAIKIKEIIGFKGEINNDLNKPDGNPRKLLDSSLINSMGWKSRVNLDDGLVKTYDWYKSNI